MEKQLAELVNNRREYLAQLIAHKSKSLIGVPDGILRGSKHHSSFQYYLRRDKTDYNGKYLKKEQRKLAEALAQKEYDQQILKAAQKEKKLLDKLTTIYQESSIEQIYENLPESFKPLVKSIEDPKRQKFYKWYRTAYSAKGFYYDAPEHYSDTGIRMRSKSECQIANMLDRFKIPYLYEKPLSLQGYGEIFPDFTFYDKEKNRYIYWEHFGRMDDPDYAEKTIRKLVTYQNNHIFLGDNLLVSYETKNTPLNSKLIEQIIRKNISKLQAYPFSDIEEEKKKPKKKKAANPAHKSKNCI